MDDVGVVDLTGETHTECVAYEGMIDGCHVFITADWDLSEVVSSTVVQKWNFTARLQPGITSSGAPSASAKSNRLSTHLHYSLSHHNLS